MKTTFPNDWKPFRKYYFSALCNMFSENLFQKYKNTAKHFKKMNERAL